MSKDIIWISSFPKSGNTWFRFILANLLYGKPVKTSRTVEQLVPSIYQFDPETAISVSGKYFVKTHLMFNEEKPIYNRTAGFIYIVRDPVHLFASAISFVNRQENEDVNELGRRFALTGYVNGYQKLGYGSWPGHIRSWLTQASRFPHLIIRYEDLIANFEYVMSNTISFLGIKGSTVDVEQVRKYTSMEYMSEMERREVENDVEGIFTSAAKRYTEKALPFVGGSKNTMDLLDDSTVEQIRTQFQPVLKNFGYQG